MERAPLDAVLASPAHNPSTFPTLAIIDKQYSLSAIGGQEDNACRFDGPPNLIARTLMHPQSVFGFEALEGGQRNAGLVSKGLLRPPQ
ncbi:MAG: hypothetical protein IJ127_14315 [Afipia sp.]|nr:hypothetical protein [Afipia sp.]